MKKKSATIPLSVPSNLFFLLRRDIKNLPLHKFSLLTLPLLLLLLLLFVCFLVQRQVLGAIRTAICEMRGKTGSDGHLDKAPGGSSGSVCEPVQILVFSLRLFSSLLLSQGKNHSAAIVVVFLFRTCN